MKVHLTGKKSTGNLSQAQLPHLDLGSLILEVYPSNCFACYLLFNCYFDHLYPVYIFIPCLFFGALFHRPNYTGVWRTK